MRTFAMITAILLAMLLASCTSNPSADVIYTNAMVWTGEEDQPKAEAVAVRDGRVIAVGSRESMKNYSGPSSVVVDVGGKLMLPGFIDDHAHFTAGGFQLQNVDLRSANDEREFTARIAARAGKVPGRWITGGDWDHDNWPGGRLPTRQMIDAVTPGTPVFVSRYDGHMALANTLVLKQAGITKETPDPPGGSIVRHPHTGEPTGILKDEAMGLVWKLMPAATDTERFEAAELALDEARKHGLTSIQDISSDEDIRIYKRLRDQGRLTARIYCRLPLGQWDELAAQKMRAGSGDEWIRMGSMKAFVDGSLGSSTALFFEPYLSDPSARGLPSDVAMNGRLERWACSADSARLQLSIHAIGDSANSLVLGIFERITARNEKWDRRFRVEHAQHIRPADFARFAALDVIASVQPYHAIDDGRWAEGRIGRERCRTAYPFKSFLDHKVRLCFGSDWTVATLNPLLGIYAAVTRRTTDGKNPQGWFPEEKISVEDAVRAYTINNAYAAFEENDKGTIAPGKLADFVVLSDDIFSIDPVKIPDVKVQMTIVGGAVVYMNTK